MSHNDFVEKLQDFFDPAQIENLEKFAQESAYDAFGNYSKTDFGRSVVCDMLYDFMLEAYPVAASLIEDIAGGMFLRSTYNDLLEQMRKEW